MSSTLSRIDILRYGVPAVPLAFAGMPLYIVAPDFYATEMGVSLSVMAIVLLCIRLFDAVQDPLIGYASDRLAVLRPAIMAVAFAFFAAGFFILYLPIADFALSSLIVGMVLATTAFSVLGINLNAVGSLLSRDPLEKTRITTTREAMGIAGLLLAILLPVVLAAYVPVRVSFALYAASFAVLCFVAAIIFVPWLARQQLTPIDTAPRLSFKDLLRAVCRQGLRGFFAAYFISMTASALPAVLVLFFMRDRLDAENLSGVFLLLYFVAALLAMPLWRRSADRFGKVRTWAVSMVMASLALVVASVLSQGDIYAYAAICVVSGMALGAELSLPPSILSDLIDRAEVGGATAGCFSVMAFLLKSALATASIAGLAILDRVGFQPAGENTVTALQTLSVLYAVIPCVLKIISAVLLLTVLRGDYSQGKDHEKNHHVIHTGGNHHAGRL